jgi:GTP-binding protein HflX
LEEVTESDLILHVRDIASHETEIQREDVRNILRQIGVDPDDGNRVIEVWNKVDLLDLDGRSSVYRQALRPGDKLQAFVLSASNGSGIDALRRGIEKRLMLSQRIVNLALEPAQTDALAWLYSNADVLEAHPQAGSLVLTVRMGEATCDLFKNKFLTRRIQVGGNSALSLQGGERE